MSCCARAQTDSSRYEAAHFVANHYRERERERERARERERDRERETDRERASCDTESESPVQRGRKRKDPRAHECDESGVKQQQQKHSGRSEGQRRDAEAHSRGASSVLVGSRTERKVAEQQRYISGVTSRTKNQTTALLVVFRDSYSKDSEDSVTYLCANLSEYRLFRSYVPNEKPDYGTSGSVS